jgi:uncharacterized protein (DUF2062 family)
MRLNFQNLYRRIKQPFQQGLHWKAVTKAIIVSFLVTIIPFFGVTTLLLTFVAIKFKLNLPIMIAINFMVLPLQVILFLPFIHIGESIMNINHTLLTIQEIKASFDVSFFNTVKGLFLELLCGLIAWLLVSLPIGFLTMILLKTTISEQIRID